MVADRTTLDQHGLVANPGLHRTGTQPVHLVRGIIRILFIIDCGTRHVSLKLVQISFLFGSVILITGSVTMDEYLE